jgi:hypothetical protein
MTKALHTLKPNQIRAAKPRQDGKPLFLNDGGGLYLRAKAGTDGVVSRWWLFRYGTTWKTIGPAADITVEAAREEARKYRDQLRNGVDPVFQARTAKAGSGDEPKTFAFVAAAYYQSHKDSWSSAKYTAQWEREVATYTKDLAGLLVADITTDHVHCVSKRSGPKSTSWLAGSGPESKTS